MNKEECRRFSLWRKKVIDTKDIAPIELGMSQENIIVHFGTPDDVSTVVKKGKPLIFKYQDIEFHFDERFGHTLFLIYSDYENDISIAVERDK